MIYYGISTAVHNLCPVTPLFADLYIFTVLLQLEYTSYHYLAQIHMFISKFGNKAVFFFKLNESKLVMNVFSS